MQVIICLFMAIGFCTNFVRVGASAPNPDKGLCPLTLPKGETPFGIPLLPHFVRLDYFVSHVGFVLLCFVKDFLWILYI